MLTNKDLQSEIGIIDETSVKLKSDYEKSMLKGVTLILKMLQSMRTNQVLAMKNAGVELLQPASRNTDDKDNVEKSKDK